MTLVRHMTLTSSSSVMGRGFLSDSIYGTTIITVDKWFVNDVRDRKIKD